MEIGRGGIILYIYQFFQLHDTREVPSRQPLVFSYEWIVRRLILELEWV